MGQPEDDELETAIRVCRAVADKMTGKRSFRLRTLLRMLQNELDRERAMRGPDRSNGHTGQSSGSH